MRTFQQKPKAGRPVGTTENPVQSTFAQRSESNSMFSFRSARNIVVQGRVGPPGDPIHDPLLDRYSTDSGLPRDTVTAHDPGYEAWLLGRSPAAPPPINITLDMPVPASVPPPDYSRDEHQLGAWEKANFRIGLQLSYSCDRVVNGGVESSFVTDIGFRFTSATFEHFIARHIYENMTYGSDRDLMRTWRQIHHRIRRHSGEHFVRYQQVVDAQRQDITRRFAALPTRNAPVQISQADLETYVLDLLRHLEARLRHALWRTTCDWEHQDYPTLLRGIPDVHGRFVPACDPEPSVPAEPIMPLVVTPRTSPVRRRSP